MRTQEFTTDGRRVVVAVLGQGDEAVAGITEAARNHGLSAAQLTAVGGFAHAVVGYFDRGRADYDRIPVTTQVEVLSLLGDIATQEGTPVVHAHAVLGRRDGSVAGGHLIAAAVWPTLEVVLTEVAPQLAKEVDPRTGLALIRLDGGER